MEWKERIPDEICNRVKGKILALAVNFVTLYAIWQVGEADMTDASLGGDVQINGGDTQIVHEVMEKFGT